MTAHVKEEGGNAKQGGGESTSLVSTSKRARSYESRKIRKPIMERKRRARINESLDELKRILLEANCAPAKKEGRPTKIDKADVLELTLKHLQSLHNNNSNHHHHPQQQHKNLLAHSFQDNNKSVISANVTSSTSPSSDAEDDNSLSRSSSNTTSSSSPGLKIDTSPATSNHNPNNLTHNPDVTSHANYTNNSAFEKYFFHGFEECIRLVGDAVMSTMTSSVAPNTTSAVDLEKNLKAHLDELRKRGKNGIPVPSLRHHHYVHHHHSMDVSPPIPSMSPSSPPPHPMMEDSDVGFGSGDEHDTMTLRSSDSPASISQLSPVFPAPNHNNANSISAWMSSNSTMRLNGSSGAVLVPTRMHNGEIAFILKPNEHQGAMRLMCPPTDTNYSSAGACCVDVINSPFSKSYGGGGRGGYETRRTFTQDNHLSINNSRGPWRPW